MEDIFFNIGVMIIVAALFALVAKRIKQPRVPAYIIAGLVIGPVLGLVSGIEIARQFSEIGIAFLLFIVGLELNLKKLKDIGLVATLGGTIQIVLLFFLGLLIGGWLKFGQIESIYLGLVVAFSSTMVVVKLLSDKSELDTLHGRIIIGFLLIEDFFAIIALSTLNTLNNFNLFFLLVAVAKAVLLVLISFGINKLLFRPLFEFSAKSQELLFLSALSSCFIFAFLFKYVGKIIMWVIHLLGISVTSGFQAMLEPGFSIAIGAFVAGISLATLPYTFDIIGKVKSLRDFFLTIFFVSLGMELTLSSIRQYLVPLLILLALVIVIKPIITFTICSIFGYTKRTSFMAAGALPQISEFGMIIVAQGIYDLQHLDKGFFTLVVMLAMASIIYTTYIMKYEAAIYSWLARVFKFRSTARHLEFLPEEFNKEVLLIGYDRIGYSIFKTLKKLEKDFVIVDFNPDIIKKLIKQGVHCIYGDAADSEIQERVHLDRIKILISTIPDSATNKLLVKKAKEVNKTALVFVTAYTVEDALSLYELGADYVILPHFLGGQHVSLLLEDFNSDFSRLVLARVKHINELEERQEMGQRHPLHERKDGAE